MKIIVTLIMLTLCFVSCHTINQRFGIKEDSIGEEILEEIIKDQTGVELDLSPGSPE